MKCMVLMCPNDSEDGLFEGEICHPCADALRGYGGDGNRHAVKRVILSALAADFMAEDIRLKYLAGDIARRRAEVT